jgi:hypothetical protein
MPNISKINKYYQDLSDSRHSGLDLPSSTFTVFYMTEFVQENGQAKKTI